MEFPKYTKVTYQSEPIGNNRIILYLTTFDLEAFKNDEKLEHIPEKKIAKCIEVEYKSIENPNFIDMISQQLEETVNKTYKKQLEEMKTYIEITRTSIPIANWQTTKIKNITNSENINCDIIQGNVVNCDNVHCKEIRGNVVNSEVYKENK